MRNISFLIFLEILAMLKVQLTAENVELAETFQIKNIVSCDLSKIFIKFSIKSGYQFFEFQLFIGIAFRLF